MSANKIATNGVSAEELKDDPNLGMLWQSGATDVSEHKKEKEEDVFHILLTDSLNNPNINWQIQYGPNLRIGQDVEEELNHEAA